MPKQRVVIELSPSRLEVALVRGSRIVDHRVQRMVLPAFSDQWRSALETLRHRLADMVVELKAQNAQATVLYAAPSAATGIFSCPRSAGRAQGQKAARLALAETAATTLDDNSHDLEHRWTDKPISGSQGGPAQNHYLGVADTNAALQVLADWIRGAGLVPHRMLPADAAGLVATVETAAAAMARPGVTVVLFAGEHGSFLAAVSHGRLRFVRQIAIGCEALVEALACKVPGADASGTDAYPVASREMLFRVGIPMRDQAIEAPGGLQASAILPILQPTVQRCVLEIRQSLRFGLDESERAGATLIGIGPAKGIPRLLEVIAEQAGLKLEKPGSDHPGAPDPTEGIIPTWLSIRQPRANLVPRSVAEQVLFRRMRRGIWIGTGIAGVLAGADAAMSKLELNRREEAVKRLSARLDETRPATDMSTKLMAAQTGLALARQRIAARLGNTVDWDAVLTMLARSTPETIKLSEIHFANTGGTATCRLVGRAPIHGGDARLQRYLGVLAGSPIVRDCRLGATQRAESVVGLVQTFDMTLSLVDLPPGELGLSRLVTTETPGDKERP